MNRWAVIDTNGSRVGVAYGDNEKAAIHYAITVLNVKNVDKVEPLFEEEEETPRDKYE